MSKSTMSRRALFGGAAALAFVGTANAGTSPPAVSKAYALGGPTIQAEVMAEFPIAAPLATILSRIPGWKLYANRATRKGSSNKTGLELFNLHSLAYTAPTTVQYVDVANGANANDGLTLATAKKSVYAAQQVLTAGGGNGGIIHVYATGLYNRADNFYGSSAAAQATVDTVFVAHSGIVDLSTSETITWTNDGTYSNTYTSSITASDWVGVFDMAAYDARKRGYVELKLVSTAAICNRTPNSYAIVSTTLYVNRADGLAPTTANTRACRGVFNFRVNSALPSIAFIGATEADGWSFMGGPPASGPISYTPLQALANPASPKCLVLSNVSTQGGFHGFTINNTYGLTYIENSGGTGSIEDIFNDHNNKGALNDVVAVNIWARDAGRPGHVSCQPWTQHDNAACRAILVCPDFDDGGGGLIRNIGGSLCQVVYPVLGIDKGDKWSTGVVDPVAIRTDDAGTTVWVLDAQIAPGNKYDLLAASGSTIYVAGRPVRRAATGGGTVADWTYPSP